MSKRTVFTTLTPLPAGISRETVMETLRSHTEMIDLNPLVEERHPIKPPPNATPEEYHCIWYSLTDRVQYLPGNLVSGKVTYTCCFHDLTNGLQTHCYAPLGLDIKGKWTLGGSLPGEAIAPVELGVGAPLHGLWLREDVDMRCNIMMGSFVKKTLKKAHSSLVGRLLVKSQIQEAARKNMEFSQQTHLFSPVNSQASTEYSPSDYDAQSISSPHRNDSNPMSPPIYSPPNTGFNPSSSSQYDQRASYDNRLYPAGLNIRNSSASYAGSAVSDQKIQPDPAAGGNHPSARVSWQSLNHGRSPSLNQNQDMSGQRRSPENRAATPQGGYAELPAQQKQRQENERRGGLNQQGQGTPGRPVELE